jgi:hypothetical protein
VTPQYWGVTERSICLGSCILGFGGSGEYTFWANFTQIVGFDEFTVALLIHSRASGRGAHAARVGGRGAYFLNFSSTTITFKKE